MCPSLGKYAICYCQANGACDKKGYTLTGLTVMGPRPEQEWIFTYGTPFRLLIEGTGYTEANRVIILQEGESCSYIASGRAKWFTGLSLKPLGEVQAAKKRTQIYCICTQTKLGDEKG